MDIKDHAMIHSSPIALQLRISNESVVISYHASETKQHDFQNGCAHRSKQ